MCPHCGRDAPLLYRGPLAYCTACNKPRVPLSAAGVNLTGKPAKLGGAVAAIFGWAVLVGALALALVLGAVLQAIFPPGAFVGWVVGGVVATLGIVAALVLLLGGRFLRRTGDQSAANARREAVFALAQNERGILRANLVASALGIGVTDADTFLTALSRQPDGSVLLEIDDDGKLFYRFPAYAPDAPWPGRAGPSPAPPGRNVRVRTGGTQLASAPGETLAAAGTVSEPTPAEDDEAAEDRRRTLLR